MMDVSFTTTKTGQLAAIYAQLGLIVVFKRDFVPFRITPETFSFVKFFPSCVLLQAHPPVYPDIAPALSAEFQYPLYGSRK